MVFLRIFLYIICFLSLVWVTFLYAGPPLVKKMINFYSNGQIIASDVTITPKFDIKIGILDLSQKDKNNQLNQVGFSRSVNVFWSLFAEVPLLSVRIGPTFIENILVADSINIQTPSLSEIDFNEIALKAEVSNLAVESLAFSEKINLEAIYQRENGSLNKVYVDIPSVDFGKSISWILTGITSNVEKISLNVPIEQQDLPFNISAEKFKNIQNSVQTGELVGSFRVYDGELVFDFEIHDFLFDSSESSVERVKGKGTYVRMGHFINGQFEILGNLNEVGDPKQTEILIDILNRKKGTYFVKLFGNIEPTELIFGTQFIGNLPASSLEADFQIDNNISKVSSTAKLKFEDGRALEVMGSGQLGLEISGTENYFDCFQQNCEIYSLDLGYKVRALEEWIEGSSVCYDPPCNFSSMSHSFKTSNTAEIFGILNREKILNPIYSAYLYSAIITGKKHENGHELNLN